jgi:hypothetical protein
MRTLVHSTEGTDSKEEVAEIIEERLDAVRNSESSSSVVLSSKIKAEKKPPRKLVEEEKRAVGRIGRSIWETYIWACGNGWYWSIFLAVLIAASASPVLENGWLK